MGNATPPAVHRLHYCSHNAGKNYDKNISNVDLSAMKGWGSKAWDGCLQVRAINVLHSICVSDYYHYYYQYYYYYYYYYCCCCFCCCCYILTQESSNHKACADWPILRSTHRSDYLITGRARGTREGGEEASSPFLSSCVLDISSFGPTKRL